MAKSPASAAGNDSAAAAETETTTIQGGAGTDSVAGEAGATQDAGAGESSVDAGAGNDTTSGGADTATDTAAAAAGEADAGQGALQDNSLVNGLAGLESDEELVDEAPDPDARQPRVFEGVYFRSAQADLTGCHKASDEVPAIITKVHGARHVDLTVFRASGNPPIGLSNVILDERGGESPLYSSWRWVH